MATQFYEELLSGDRDDDALITEHEKRFLSEGINEYNYRLDGRGPLDFRSAQIEVGVANHASGSARVRLGSSFVLVAIKTAIHAPDPRHPKEGLIEITVESTEPRRRHRDDEERDKFTAEQIQQIFNAIYNNGGGIDKRRLCIVEKSKCWALFFDIVIFEQGTSILDAASIALKAALANTKFSNVTVVEDELDDFNIEYSDDPYDFWTMDVRPVPTVTSFYKIGSTVLVDATEEEVMASDASAVTSGNIDGILFYFDTDWKGSAFGFELRLIEELIEVSAQISRNLNDRLHALLQVSSDVEMH